MVSVAVSQGTSAVTAVAVRRVTVTSRPAAWSVTVTAQDLSRPAATPSAVSACANRESADSHATNARMASSIILEMAAAGVAVTSTAPTPQPATSSQDSAPVSPMWSVECARTALLIIMGWSRVMAAKHVGVTRSVLSARIVTSPRASVSVNRASTGVTVENARSGTTGSLSTGAKSARAVPRQDRCVIR